MSRDQRYGESRRVQKPCVRWLESRRNYHELFSDDEAAGADLDSIGLLDGRLCLIEFKHVVTLSGVRRSPPVSGTVEAKFLRYLKRLYGRDRVGADVAAALDAWDFETPPLLVLAAAGYSTNGMIESRAMFEALSVDLHADWEIWKWDGSRVVVCGTGAIEGPPVDYGATDVMAPLPTPSREPALSIVELRELAGALGFSDVFDHGIDAAKAAGLTRVLRRRTISFDFPARHPFGSGTAISLYLDKSSTDAGLLCGYVRDYFRADPLPDLSVAPPGGYLNTDVWIRSAEDIDRLLLALSTGRSAVMGDQTLPPA